MPLPIELRCCDGTTNTTWIKPIFSILKRQKIHFWSKCFTQKARLRLMYFWSKGWKTFYDKRIKGTLLSNCVLLCSPSNGICHRFFKWWQKTPSVCLCHFPRKHDDLQYFICVRFSPLVEYYRVKSQSCTRKVSSAFLIAVSFALRAPSTPTRSHST